MNYHIDEFPEYMYVEFFVVISSSSAAAQTVDMLYHNF